MIINENEAKELGRVFREMSVALGDYRFDNWSKLSQKRRSNIESLEWTLLNYSSDFINQYVGIILEDAEISLTNILQATEGAAEVIASIKSYKKTIYIVTSVVELAAAVVTKNPIVITSAVSNLLSSLEGEPDGPSGEGD